MSAQPFGAPLFRAFDANGAPLVGGLLYTYAGGTSTPLATYTDATGATPNTNPVVLDSTGTAQVWLSPGVLYKFVLKDVSAVQQWSVDNYPAPGPQLDNNPTASNEAGGRLTFSSTLAVTTADLTAQTTVYYLPYKSDQVPLYDGTNWALASIGAGLSQALSDATRSPAAAVGASCYDLFVWMNGTPTLSRGPAWASDVSRGAGAGTTQLVQVNGRWVNAQAITNGPAANRGLYVGTLRTDGGALGNDSLALRHLWNCFNRRPRAMQATDATNTWTYTTATWRQANASAGNQLDYVVGLTEDMVCADVMAAARNSTAGVPFSSSIGVDSTSVPSGVNVAGVEAVINSLMPLSAKYRGFPGIGRHYLAWLEYSGATGTTTWAGTATASTSGISGEVFG